jgi:hypothetical protein
MIKKGGNNKKKNVDYESYFANLEKISKLYIKRIVT